MLSKIPSAYFAAAFASGAAALVYQVVWARLLSRPLGSSALATALVLGLFLLGLSLGALAASRSRFARTQPLFFFAICEMVAGVWAYLLPLVIDPLQPFLVAAQEPGIRTILPTFIVVLLVIPPTMAMGAGFPALVQACTQFSKSNTGREGGNIYAMNTLGAGAGAFAAALFLLPRMGLLGAGHLAAGLDLMIAFWAFRAREPASREEASSTARLPSIVPGRRVVFLALILSGFATLGLEVVWIRTLSLLLGASAYMVGLVVGVLVLGLGAGAWIVSFRTNWLESRKSAARVMCGSLGLAGILSWFAHLAVPQLPELVHTLTQTLRASPWMLLTGNISLTAILLLPFAIALGASFPAGLRLLCSDKGATSNSAGVAYALNSAGALLGAVVATLVLVPFFGLRVVLVGNAALLLLTAWLLLPLAVSWSRMRRGIAACFIPFILLGSWPVKRMATAPYLYEAELHGTVLFDRDGRDARATVVRNGPWLELRVNGKVDASTRRDRETQLFIGELGALLHPDPQRVMVIGFGSGMTVSALLAHPEVEQLDCVELEQEVVRAGMYFRAWNRGALADARTTLQIGDGRAFLAGAPDAYDVIVSQPSNPWIVGMSDLFTKEAFQTAKASLKDGGVFVQWLQGYRLSLDDVQAISRTFREVFPDAQLWMAGRALGDLALVGGSPDPQLDRIGAILSSDSPAREDLRTTGILQPSDFPARLLLAGENLQRFSGSGSILRDRHPWLEYTAPLSLHDQSHHAKVIRALAAQRSDPSLVFGLGGEIQARLKRLRVSRGLLFQALADANAMDAAMYYETLREGLAYVPDDADVARFLARALTDRGLLLLEANREAEAQTVLREAAMIDPLLSKPQFTLGLLADRNGEKEEARYRYEAYLESYPYDPDGWRLLAQVQAELGEIAHAELSRLRAESLEAILVR